MLRHCAWLLIPLQALILQAPAVLAETCVDALEGSEIAENKEPEPPVRFLPEDHTGPVCMALLPACMTRSQWAKVCEGWRAEDPNYVYSRSCREALEIKEMEGEAELAE